MLKFWFFYLIFVRNFYFWDANKHICKASKLIFNENKLIWEASSPICEYMQISRVFLITHNLFRVSAKFVSLSKRLVLHVALENACSDSSTLGNRCECHGSLEMTIITDSPCHRRCGTLKNHHCSIAITAEHRSKFAALHWSWWRLHMSEKLSSGTKTFNIKDIAEYSGPVEYSGHSVKHQTINLLNNSFNVHVFLTSHAPFTQLAASTNVKKKPQTWKF